MLSLTVAKKTLPWILWLLLLGGSIDKSGKKGADLPKGGGVVLPLS
jgi:hypothetical protein